LDIAKANVCALEYSLTSTQPLLTDVFSGKQCSVPEVIEEYKKNGVKIEFVIGSEKDKTIYPLYHELHKINWKPTFTFSEIISSELV
jgi:UDP-glucose 4-epimerase